MANKPDEKQLVDLIAAAFNRLPEPAPAKLKAVEERLTSVLRQRETKGRTAGWYWWLLVGLAATGAAAWWGGTLWRPAGEEKSTPVEIIETAPSGREEGSRSGAPRKEAPVEMDQKRSPTIYRRERP